MRNNKKGMGIRMVDGKLVDKYGREMETDRDAFEKNRGKTDTPAVASLTPKGVTKKDKK